MHQVLLVVQVLVAVGLIALVLIQQGKGADVGASFGSGASGSLFGSRGPTSFLAKMTASLAAVFFANSIALAYISGQAVDRRSVTEVFQAPAGDASDSDASQSSDIPAPSAPTQASGQADSGDGASDDAVPAPSQRAATEDASADTPQDAPKEDTSN